VDKAKRSFQAIRDIATEKLMFAKDDLIIPLELSLYFFEAGGVKGKYGPLFEFYDDAETVKRPRNKNDVCGSSLFLCGGIFGFADDG
jgi:XAP5, circadian clock regulator